jgi:hypothetical protein
MPEFLAETYAPRDAAAPPAAGIARAAEQVSEPGAPVRFLGAVVVPEEETCFWLYQAPSAGAVRAAMARARLQPDRITPAVPIRPPRARRGARPSDNQPRTGRVPTSLPRPPHVRLSRLEHDHAR